MMAKLVPTLCKALAALGIGTIALSTVVIPARAATLWNEDVSGDLSDNHAAPTDVGTLMDGSNLLIANINNPNPATGTQDRDYFTFFVPQGFVLSQIILEQFSDAIDDVGFIAINKGPQIIPPPPTNAQEQADAAPLLDGYTLIGVRTTYDSTTACNNLGIAGDPLAPNTITNPGNDLLAQMGIKDKPDVTTNCGDYFEPIGFAAPLEGGMQYSIWVQQTSGTGRTDYQLNLVAARVPEPTFSLGLLVFGVLGLGLAKEKL